MSTVLDYIPLLTILSNEITKAAIFLNSWIKRQYKLANSKNIGISEIQMEFNEAMISFILSFFILITLADTTNLKK